MKRIRTARSKRAHAYHTSLRILQPEAELWLAAASVAGISRADFIRSALKERATAILTEKGLTVEEVLKKLGVKPKAAA